MRRGMGLLAVAALLPPASGGFGAELWRSTFDAGADGVVDIYDQVTAKTILGPVTSGRLQVTAWDNSTNMYTPDKAGRPLGTTLGGSDSFSGLYTFAWSTLNTETVPAFEFAGFLGDSQPWQTRPVCGALLRHHAEGGSYRLTLGVGFGAYGLTWFGDVTGPSVDLGAGALTSTYLLAVGYDGTTHVVSVGLFDTEARELGSMSVDLDTDVPALQGPPPWGPADEYSRLAVTHLGWMDYTGNGGDRATVWQVDELVCYSTAGEAFDAARQTGPPATYSGVEPRWSSDRQHRVLVHVEPVGGLLRPSDEGVARVPIDFDSLLAGLRCDLASLQVIGFSPQTGEVIPFDGNAYATNPGDRPLRFYDQVIPWNYPDRIGNAHSTSGVATPIIYMAGGGRFFNTRGDGRRGQIAWTHTQQGDQPAYYAIYFDTLAGNISSTPPAGFLGDGVNRCMQTSDQFAPVIHGRVDVADVNGDGAFDLLMGNATGTILQYENEGSSSGPAFGSPTLLFTDDGAPLDVGWSAAPRAVDWDRDGDLDLLVGAERGGIVFFRNTGTRTSPLWHREGLLPADGQPIQMPISPCAEDPTNTIFTIDYYPVLEVVDWDGDGDLDLLAGGYITGLIFYYENIAPSPNVAPVLTSRGPLQADGQDLDVTWTAAPTVADFDGDGDLDLISGAMQMTAGGGDLSDPARFLWYYRNVGTRTAPQLSLVFPFPGFGTFRFGALGTPRAVDFNGDGLLDLVVSTGGSLLLLVNIGTPTSPAYDAAALPLSSRWGNAPLGFSQIVDYDGDGWPDLFSRYLVQLNTGQGAPGLFGPPILLPGANEINHPSPSGDAWDYRALADMDRDGHKDILFGDHEGYVWFHRDMGSDEAPHFDPVGNQLELAAGGLLKVEHPPGTAPFDILQGLRTVVAPGDYNHDGWEDLVVADTHGFVRLFLRMPGGPVVFGAGVEVAKLHDIRLTAQGTDWNGDGWDDILAAYASGQSYIILNRAQEGSAVFQNAIALNLPPSFGSPEVHVGDWNRDGDDDLLVQQYGYTRFVERSFMQSGYAEARILRFDASPRSMCHAPGVDADGDADVDMEDFGRFQACMSGPGGGLPGGCICFDVGEPGLPLGDGDIDGADLAEFLRCLNGAGLAPACGE